jgi:glycosyltransferase involved in cell wall biosynthesis
VCLTTFNSEKTIRPCIESVLWADEIVVVDSGSTDQTREILAEYPVQVIEQPWLGYACQKQISVDAATHDWVFLLDSDEVLSVELQEQVQQLLTTSPEVAGFEFPRREQLFWRMIHPGTRHNYFMRLFNRRCGKMNAIPIHAAFKVNGPVERINAPLLHFSESSISVKVAKLNVWTDEISRSRFERGKCRSPWALPFYPPFVFLRHFIFKRNFRNGWAGFIASVSMAFYAFLKDAKGLEHARRAVGGDSDLIAKTLRRDGQPVQPPSDRAVASDASGTINDGASQASPLLTIVSAGDSTLARG